MINVCRKAEGAAFKALVPDGKAIAIPIKDFHKGMMAIEKDEEVVGKRIGFENIADDGSPLLSKTAF